MILYAIPANFSVIFILPYQVFNQPRKHLKMKQVLYQFSKLTVVCAPGEAVLLPLCVDDTLVTSTFLPVSGLTMGMGFLARR